jgi:alkylation response protein AidB-like acyl-CoA dehydrogenase
MATPRTADAIHDAIVALSSTWRPQRAERQQRRALERADFDALAGTGFLLSAVPADQGGCWESVAASTRPVCAQLRVLATADASVALVAAMHPAVLGYWLGTGDATQPAWEEQRRAVFATAANGRQWGTITSEPGSGGDIMRTRTRAEPDAAATASDDVPGRRYRLSGDKHFGSGFGISDYMFTTARADDDDAPGLFFMDMRAARAAGGAEVTITGEWDGAGMTATQSHAARLERMPATRLAWTGEIDVLTANAAPFISMAFTAVVLGVFDVAITYAREQLGPKRDTLRAFEQVEWIRADLEYWTAVQAFEGALRTIETADPGAGLHAGLRAKTAVAEAAEGALRRVAQVLGGGTFSRRSPVSGWFEDVRALGFLRPPWGLAYDGLFATSFGG